MSAIITHRFRKNNVQKFFDEMTLPSVMIAGCISSGITVTASSGTIPANLQVGMAVTTTSGTGVFATPMTTIVTSVSTNSFQIYPQPTTSLSGATLSFYSQYYMGIGKSDPYNGGLDGSDASPASPAASAKTEVDVRNNLIALQKVIVALNTGSAASQSAIYGNAGYVLPRYNWASGTYFKAWDPSDPSCFYPSTLANGSTAYPCYAVWNSGSGDKVYICAQSGIDSSSQLTVSVQPHTNNTVIGTVGAAGSDSYQWTYVSDLGLDTGVTLSAKNLTTASGNTSSTLDSNQFFKIYRRATTTGSSVPITTPTASAGKIYSCRVVSGGLGYTTASVFSVEGDGTSAAGIVTSVDAAGSILSVIMTASGSGYTTGAIRFTSGAGTSPATIIPRIAPKNGFGYDVVSDLPAWYAGFYGNFTYDSIYPGTADVPSTDQIRQLSLLRNPVVYTSTSGSTITYRCLKSFVINTTSGTAVPAAGDVVEQTSSGTGANPRGYVDFVNVGTLSTTIYYHQNSSTFGSAGLNITPIAFTTGSGYIVYKKPNYGATPISTTSTITSVTSSEEYVGGTGEVLFVQNRVPITQAPGQTEAITIVTQF